MKPRVWLSALALSAGLSTVSAMAQVTGTVKLDGKAPEMAKIDMSGVAQCAQQHSTPVTQETVLTGADNGLANAVIPIKREEGMDLPGNVPGNAAGLDQQGCQYVPHAVALTDGQDLKVKHRD